jgi:acetamidase/formamidase
MFDRPPKYPDQNADTIIYAAGTAIETPMKVTVRLSVRKDKPYTKTPHFKTAVIANSKPEEEYYCTTGIDSGMIRIDKIGSTIDAAISAG